MNSSMTLVTRFLLDPKNYEDGAKVVEGATRRATGAIESLTGGIMSGLRGALRAVLSPVAALAGGAGILALAHSAVQAAIGFDTIQRSLEAVTGSAERAKEVLKFDDKLAGPSIFTSEDLARASLTLEAFKLKTEEFLPVVERIATVFGGNTEALRQFTDALGYIANGRFGEGFESLTRAGFSRKDFEAKGLEFDKGGEYKGTSEDALKAIKELSEEKFGKLSQAMADGPAAKMASVMDAIGRAARVAGFAIISVLAPAFEHLGTFVSWLVDSGTLQRAVDGLSGMFSGQGFGGFLVEATAWLIATLMHIPGIVAGIGQAFQGLFGWLRENLIRLGMVFVAIWTFTEVLAGLKAIGAAIKLLQEGEKALGVVAAIAQAIMTDGASLVLMAATAALAGTAAAAIFAAAVPKVGDLPAFKPLENTFDAIRGDKDKMVTAFNLDQSKGPTGAANSIIDAVAQTLSPLNAIQNHAQKTAEHTRKLVEVQDKILGGGTVGKGAASAVNLDKALHGTGASGGGDEADQIAVLIRRMVERTSGAAIVNATYQARAGR